MTISEHKRRVLSKLGFTKKGGGKHEKWRLMDASTGRPILTTGVSRSNEDVGHGLLKKYRTQLGGITKDQYNEIASCNMSKAEYIEWLFEKGVISH